jgi:hypothetical protein
LNHAFIASTNSASDLNYPFLRLLQGVALQHFFILIILLDPSIFGRDRVMDLAKF